MKLALLKFSFSLLPKDYRTAILNALWYRTTRESASEKNKSNERIRAICKVLAMYLEK